MIWYVYVARCADDTLYCGIARDVAARIAQHDAGRGARYTRGRGPLTVAFVRACPDKPAALRLEHQIKQLGRAAKQALIAAAIPEPGRRAGGRRSGDTARDAEHSGRRPARLGRRRRGAPAVRARGR